MPTYKEYSGIERLIGKKLDNIIQSRAETFVQRYAVSEDGTLNQELADRIRFEVMRRGDMSRELDVYEPVRWAGASALLSFAAGSMAKYVLGERNIEKIVTTGVVTGIAGTLVQLVRPYFRFEAALYASAQTALGSYERNDRYTANGQPMDGDVQMTTQQPSSYTVKEGHLHGRISEENARELVLCS